VAPHPLVAFALAVFVVAPWSPSPPTTQAEAPFDIQPGVEVRTADGVTLTLDTYMPRAAGPHPAVVLVHGGSWTGGDKTDLAAIGAALTQFGWVALSVNYRLGVEILDQQAEDILTTVRWARDHAGELDLDPRRVAVLGASAGGHLAALAATEGSDAAAIDAVVTWSGVFDLGALAPRSAEQAADCNALCQQTFGSGVLEGVVGCSYDECPARYADVSPVNHLGRAAPPMLLASSEDDAVPPAQAREMAGGLRSVGVPAEIVLVDGEAHGYDLGTQVWTQTTGFLEQQFAPPEGQDRNRSSVRVVAFVASLAALVGAAIWFVGRARARRRYR
jgi:acetyl esterase/lipase